MACTASRGWSKVTVPIPRLLPSLSSLTSARLTIPAMPNTSFNFFQPTLKSNCKKQESTLFMMSFKGNFLVLRNDLTFSHWPQILCCPGAQLAAHGWLQEGYWGCLQWKEGCSFHHNPCPAPAPPAALLPTSAAHAEHVLHQDPKTRIELA